MPCSKVGSVGKKKDQSLTERISALINRVGEKPAPGMDVIKSALVPCLSLAESLEEDAVIREAEARVAVLEKALEDSNTEKGQLQTELESLRTEVEGFKEEQRERERKIDPMLFKILQRLPSQAESKWVKIDEISRVLKTPVDEAEVYMNGLEKLGLAFFHHHEPGGGGWHRTTEGNTLVVAKRWAGDKEDQKKFADLSESEEIILEMLKSGGLSEDILHIRLIALGSRISIEKTVYVLRGMKEKGFVNYNPDEQTYGQRHTWWMTDAGTDYLAERDKL